MAVAGRRARRVELTANGAEFGSEDCPGDGRWSSIDTGEFELRVTATGPWRLTIYQQVESPLREPRPRRSPPAPPSSSPREASTGSRTGGRARPGCIACRMVGSRCGWRDSARQRTPTCSYGSARTPPDHQAGAELAEQIATLKSTLGDQNYLLPEGFDSAAARSVVIWCEPIQIAYTAATLSG